MRDHDPQLCDIENCLWCMPGPDQLDESAIRADERRRVIAELRALDRGYFATRIELTMRSYAKNERTRRSTVEALVSDVLYEAASLLAPEGDGERGGNSSFLFSDPSRVDYAREPASPSSEPAQAGDPNYGDLVDALDAAGCELTAFEQCSHQGTLIRWERPARDGETFVGLPVADPVVGEVVEYHFVPHDLIPVDATVMRVTITRAIQRAIWDVALHTRKEAPMAELRQNAKFVMDVIRREAHVGPVATRTVKRQLACIVSDDGVDRALRYLVAMRDLSKPRRGYYLPNEEARP